MHRVKIFLLPGNGTDYENEFFSKEKYTESLYSNIGRIPSSYGEQL